MDATRDGYPAAPPLVNAATFAKITCYETDPKRRFQVTDPTQHADKRGAIESILRNIPGFRGYLEKEYRRESDALARAWLADQLEQGKRALDNWGRMLVDAGQIDALPQIDRIRSRADKVVSRLKGAMHGYSGFFDFVEVDEHRLDDIYDHDLSTITEVDAFVESVKSAAGSDQSPLAAVSEILSQLDAIEQKIDERNNLLKGLGSQE